MPPAPRLSDEEIATRLERVPDWRRDGDAIRRRVKLADFAASMRLVNAVAEAAEAADHHPDILIEWNRATFTLSTHASGGLTAKDFDLAQRIDALASAELGAAGGSPHESPRA